MRKRLVVLSLAPVFVALMAAPAVGAPPSTDPPTAAKIAATWLAHQVNDEGFIPLAGNPSAPNLSNSAQAVIALAAAGVGRPQVDALVAYLGGHIDELVVQNGLDNPGALSYLILGIVGSGGDPTDFGADHEDLVGRLEATQQPSGVFGADVAFLPFDGAFRQGLSLLALHAAGHSNAAGADWLEGQQCADGLWTAYRADTSVACPAVNPDTFEGPDTNSTALAAVGLKSQGRTTAATDGGDALLAVRSAGGGWGYLAASDQATDANSTGLVLMALRSIKGSQDAQGVAALMGLQIGCDADPADVGGIEFQTGFGPDVLSTEQGILGLADVVVPIVSATISPDLVTACEAPATTTSTSTSVPDDLEAGTRPNEIARTGSAATLQVGIALALIGTGGVLVELAETRRRRRT